MFNKLVVIQKTVSIIELVYRKLSGTSDFRYIILAKQQIRINVLVVSFHFFSIVVVCRSLTCYTVIPLQTRRQIDDAGKKCKFNCYCPQNFKILFFYLLPNCIDQHLQAIYNSLS